MGETLAQRLKRLRDEKGLSVVALALAVGTSEGSMGQIESGGVKSPSLLLGL